MGVVLMNIKVRRGVQVLCYALAVILSGSLAYSATPKAPQVEGDKKGKPIQQPLTLIPKDALSTAASTSR